MEEIKVLGKSAGSRRDCGQNKEGEKIFLFIRPQVSEQAYSTQGKPD